MESINGCDAVFCYVDNRKRQDNHVPKNATPIRSFYLSETGN